jgi:2Fe-2S ferredoxin
VFKRAKASDKNQRDSVIVETSDSDTPVEISFTGEISLLRLVLKRGLEISHSCDGNASCGTCRIVVADESELPERNELEQEIANDRGFTANERLACQLLAKRGMKIRIP